jgi:hypothetical protein
MQRWVGGSESQMRQVPCRPAGCLPCGPNCSDCNHGDSRTNDNPRAAGLCGPQTVCLVSFELRSSQVKEVFLRESGREFSRVERLSKSALPKCYQVEHIELYKLQV